jgi:copper resistance protein C
MMPPFRRRCAWLSGAAGLALAFGLAGPARAQIQLAQGEPAPGAVLAAPPRQISLRFSEAVDPVKSFIAVANKAGHRVDQGKTTLNSATPQILEVALKTLSPGSYTVVWRVIGLSQRPSHGDFTFTVKP